MNKKCDDKLTENWAQITSTWFFDRRGFSWRNSNPQKPQWNSTKKCEIISFYLDIERGLRLNRDERIDAQKSIRFYELFIEIDNGRDFRADSVEWSINISFERSREQELRYKRDKARDRERRKKDYCSRCFVNESGMIALHSTRISIELLILVECRSEDVRV